MDMSGWHLFCGYFRDTCIDELRGPFALDGFRISIGEVTYVVFKRLDVFIEIGYEDVTYPNCSPRVIIGFGDGAFNEYGGMNAAVPLWFLIPKGEPAEKYPLWKFSSETQLREVLRRIKAEVVDPYARPLLENVDALERAVADFRQRCV